MKAKDVMIPLYDYLRPENTIKDAVNFLRTTKRSEDRIGVKGAPVIDKNEQLIGMVSMSDILRAAHPFYLSVTNVAQFTWETMLTDMAKRVGNRRVKDIMTKDVIIVQEDTTLMACVDLLLKNRIKRLPVVNKQGKVIGMVYERDIFFACVHAMLNDLKCID